MGDCCSNKKTKKHSKESKEIDWKTLVLWIAIGILGLVVLLTIFSGESSAGTSAISATKTAGQAAGSYGGMVGGC